MVIFPPVNVTGTVTSMTVEPSLKWSCSSDRSASTEANGTAQHVDRSADGRDVVDDLDQLTTIAPGCDGFPRALRIARSDDDVSARGSEALREAAALLAGAAEDGDGGHDQSSHLARGFLRVRATRVEPTVALRI